jgi:hypothetical protein
MHHVPASWGLRSDMSDCSRAQHSLGTPRHCPQCYAHTHKLSCMQPHTLSLYSCKRLHTPCRTFCRSQLVLGSERWTCKCRSLNQQSRTHKVWQDMEPDNHALSAHKPTSAHVFVVLKSPATSIPHSKHAITQHTHAITVSTNMPSLRYSNRRCWCPARRTTAAGHAWRL